MPDYKTPCYVIDERRLEANLSAFLTAFSREWGKNFAMGHSIKTNHLPWLIRHSYAKGLLAEAVSDDEFKLALNCGIPPEHIILNGPEMGAQILKTAVLGKSIINIDNFEELKILDGLLDELRLVEKERENLLIGLRLNFDLEALCPGETTAGSSVSRFGFCLENGEFERAVQKIHRMGLKVRGLHLHYSTKTRSRNIFAALAHMAGVVTDRYNLEEEISYIDVGGGFFGGRPSSAYPTPSVYASVIAAELRSVFCPEKVKLIIEPGASVLATAIDYRCKVISVKTVRGVHVVTLDGTSLHINPFQVNRQPPYLIRSLEKKPLLREKQIVCGNTCMEKDRFFESTGEVPLSVGDEVIFENAGAYSMGFNSCFIHVPPAVYVLNRDESINCIRERIQDLMLEN